MADSDLPPSLRGGGAADDLPPSLRGGSASVADLPPSLRNSGPTQPFVSSGVAPSTVGNDALGESRPVEQKLIDNINAAGAGYFLPELPGQIIRGVKNIPKAVEAVKNLPETIKAVVTKLFTKAPEMAEVPPSAAIPDLPQTTPTPETPSQPELPLQGEATQERLFEPLPKPVQIGVNRIANDLGKKYGGVSSHMPEMIDQTARIYADDPQKAEAFLNELLPRLTRVSSSESGFGYVNKFGQEGSGKSIPFPSEEIANQFKQELLSKLQEHPLLQRDIGTQLGLFAPREGAQNLIEAPKPVQGEGFTMSNDPTAQPPAASGVDAGTPTQPFTQQPSAGPVPQQQDLFNMSRYGGKIENTPQARLAAAIHDKDLPSPLPAGAAERLAKQAELAKDGKLSDIPTSTPLTDRLDFNQRVEGTKTGVFYDQYKTGADAANAVDRDSTALYKNFQSKFNIAANSKESAAMQVYGEAKNKSAAVQALTDVFGKEKTDNIVQAADWMRGQYDNLWVETNKALVASGRPAIPYRQDYFTHFKEIGLLDQLGVLGSGTPEAQAQILARYQTADQLVQQSRFSKLKDIIFPFMKRQNGDFTTDAVEGFRRYAFASNRIQKLQPYVNELNESARILQPTHPGASKYIQDQANHLSGVADSWDKVITDRLGPKALNIWTQLNRRYMSNLVEANPHVPFMHAMTESLNVAEHSLSSNLKAAVGQLMNPEMRAFALENSPTLQARIASTDARTLDAGLVRKSISSAMTWMDQQIGTHIFLTTFKDAVAQGKPVDEAIKLADNFVGQTQGMISPVNTPPIMRSRVLGNLAPFQNRALAYAKTVFRMWDDKTVPAAALSTVKFGLATAAAAYAEQAIFGHTSGVVGRAIPFGETIQRGVGGPVLQSGARAVAALDKGDFKNAGVEALKTGIMLSPIPGAMNTVIRPGEMLLKHFQENQ